MKKSESFANCVDPDQTPRSVVSDLCLHCLPITLLRDARSGEWLHFQGRHLIQNLFCFISEKGSVLIGNNLSITKTCLCNFDPLKPHFYIVKLGFTGLYIIFLIFAQNIDCGYSLEPPCRGGSNEYPQSLFWAKLWKIWEFFYLNVFSFWRWNFLYIWIGVFS